MGYLIRHPVAEGERHTERELERERERRGRERGWKEAREGREGEGGCIAYTLALPHGVSRELKRALGSESLLQGHTLVPVKPAHLDLRAVHPLGPSDAFCLQDGLHDGTICGGTYTAALHVRAQLCRLRKEGTSYMDLPWNVRTVSYP
jgi:hypothetical protein